MLEGVFGVHQAPPMPPKKVRKFCSFDPLNGELRRQTPMDLKIWNNFQDQTFTAKVTTPPKYMYELRLNGLCEIPGTFYVARSAKF